jgi:hypothetical protein
VSTEAPDAVLAIDAPGVRSSLRSYRWRALAVLLAGIGLFVGFAAAAVKVETAADELQRTGYRVPGEISHVDPGFRTSGSVDITYTYLDVPRRAVVHLDSDSPRYQVGEPVVVVMDRDDPERVTLVGENNDPPATVLPMIAALIGGVIAMPAGGIALIRARRQRQLLAAEPWRRTKVRYRLVTAGRSARGVLLVEHEGVAHLLLVPTMARYRLRNTQISDTGEVDLVGDVTRQIVVRSVAGGPLVTGEHPRRAGTRLRWARRAFPDQYR